jgi:hypothetical protein
MKLPRVRLKVWVMMALVAVVALALAAERWKRHRDFCRFWAEMYRDRRQNILGYSAVDEMGLQELEREARLASEYERIMWRPWASLPPDPIVSSVYQDGSTPANPRYPVRP